MNIEELASNIGSSGALNAVATRLGMTPDQAQATLQGVLQHVSTGAPAGDAVEGVAARAGVAPAQVEQFLPEVMGLLKRHADSVPEGVQGRVSGLLGSLTSSPLGGMLSGLDANKDGSIVDDALGMAKGLFGPETGDARPTTASSPMPGALSGGPPPDIPVEPRT